MAVFFFVIGLEIKRALLTGELRSRAPHRLWDAPNSVPTKRSRRPLRTTDLT
jgi:hypothetical protein